MISRDRELDPESILPQPTQHRGEARQDSEDLGLAAYKEQALREIAGHFGIGGEEDVVAHDAMLPSGYVGIIEGGLAWKIDAEASLAYSAGTLVFAGTKYRKTTEKEQEFASKHLYLSAEEIGETEYDLARNIGESLPGFVPLEEDLVLPFGYDINDNHSLIQEPTGQFVQIGHVNNKPVILLIVDREPLEDGKYRNQPDTAALMGVVADVLTVCGDNETAVGLTTSNAYPSRAIDAVRAGWARKRYFGVSMYGRDTLAIIKGGVVAEPIPIHQITSELRVAYDKLKQLALEIQSPS